MTYFFSTETRCFTLRGINENLTPAYAKFTQNLFVAKIAIENKEVAFPLQKH